MEHYTDACINLEDSKSVTLNTYMKQLLKENHNFRVFLLIIFKV